MDAKLFWKWKIFSNIVINLRYTVWEDSIPKRCTGWCSLTNCCVGIKTAKLVIGKGTVLGSFWALVFFNTFILRIFTLRSLSSDQTFSLFLRHISPFLIFRFNFVCIRVVPLGLSRQFVGVEITPVISAWQEKYHQRRKSWMKQCSTADRDINIPYWYLDTLKTNFKVPWYCDVSLVQPLCVHFFLV